MPMNLESVGAVSSPGERRGPRRTRCSTRSASARARPTRPGSSSSSRPRTRGHRSSACCRRCPVIISMGGGRGLPSWGDFDFRDAAARRAGRDGARPIPAEGEVDIDDADRRHLRQGQGRGHRGSMETESKYVGLAASPRSRHALRARSSAVKAASARAAATRSPTRRRSRDAKPDHEVTYATRRRPGAAVPAARATATRCTPTRRSPSSPASERPILHGLCTYGFTGRALLHELCGSDAGEVQGDGRALLEAGDAGRRADREDVGRRQRQGALPDGHPGRRRRHRRRPSSSTRNLHLSAARSPSQAEGDGGGADERAVGAERAGDDAGAARELDAAARVDLGLRGGEERRAEAERDRTGDDREIEVEQVGDARDRAPDERAGACRRSSGGASAGGRPVMRAIAVPDASASRQPRAPHAALVAVGLDDDVADVPGVAAAAVEQPAVGDDAAADAGRHDHPR